MGRLYAQQKNWGAWIGSSTLTPKVLNFHVVESTDRFCQNLENDEDQ